MWIFQICNGLAQVTGWEPYDLSDLAHIFRVVSVLHRYIFYTTSHNGRYGIYCR